MKIQVPGTVSVAPRPEDRPRWRGGSGCALGLQRKGEHKCASGLSKRGGEKELVDLILEALGVN